jgi:hypothetical protein
MLDIIHIIQHYNMVHNKMFHVCRCEFRKEEVTTTEVGPKHNYMQVNCLLTEKVNSVDKTSSIQ